MTILWRTHEGELIPKCKALMGDVPSRLQMDVSYEEMQKILWQVPMFRSTATNFLKLMASKLITYVFAPGDMVVYRNEVSDEMYIIRRGLVEILAEDRSTVVATLGTGGFFGDVGLIFGEQRTADVRTKTYCELAMLQKPDFEEVLDHFPQIKHQFKNVCKNGDILEKIRSTAKEAEVDKMIETKRTKITKKKSFFGKDGTSERTKEEEKLDEQLRNEFSKPYKDLHPVLWLFSWLLMRRTFEPEGRFHFWLNFVTNVFSVFLILFSSWVWAFQSHQEGIAFANYSLYGYWVVFMYLQMHVAYPNDDNVLITHPLSTCKNYFLNRFLWDVVSTAPMEMIPYETISNR